MRVSSLFIIEIVGAAGCRDFEVVSRIFYLPAYWAIQRQSRDTQALPFPGDRQGGCVPYAGFNLGQDVLDDMGFLNPGQA